MGLPTPVSQTSPCDTLVRPAVLIKRPPRQADSLVEVCGHDEGSFVPEDEIPRLFEKFYRTLHPRQGQQQGWGLGLTLVKAIVDDHKGHIRVESARDAGTRFILELPILASTHHGS